MLYINKEAMESLGGSKSSLRRKLEGVCAVDIFAPKRVIAFHLHVSLDDYVDAIRYILIMKTLYLYFAVVGSLKIQVI